MIVTQFSEEEFYLNMYYDIVYLTIIRRRQSKYC